MFLGMDIYSWIAAIVIALIVTFLPITLPFKIVLAMVAMACFYFGRKYYHNHKNGLFDCLMLEKKNFLRSKIGRAHV